MIAYLYQLDSLLKDNKIIREKLAYLSKESSECIDNLNQKDETNKIKCSSKIIAYNNFLYNTKNNFLVDTYEVCLKRDSNKLVNTFLFDIIV